MGKISVLLLILAFGVPVVAQVDDTPYRTDKASPRIDQLRREIAGGKADAAAGFWRELKAEGGPLVESIAGDPGHVLLTFVFQGDNTMKSVALNCQLTTPRDFASNTLANLAGTDVWFKTYWIRNDLRFSYSFIMDPAPGAPPSPEQMRADPLNPKKLAPDTGVGLSYVELPGAKPQPWIVRNEKIPPRRLITEHIESVEINDIRPYQVYLPANHDPKRAEPYPLIVIFDGEEYADSAAIPTVETLDNLTAAGKLPPVVAVFITQAPQPRRNAELTNNQYFLDFVTKELLPYVRRDYHATADPRQTVVIGSSTGGLAAAFFAFRRPDVYGNVLSQSGALWPGQTREDPWSEWLTHQYETARKVPVHFVLQVGTLERWNTPGNRLSILAANRHLRDVLLKKGNRVDYSEEGGGHEPLSWRGGLAEGLIQLLGAK